MRRHNEAPRLVGLTQFYLGTALLCGRTDLRTRSSRSASHRHTEISTFASGARNAGPPRLLDDLELSYATGFLNGANECRSLPGYANSKVRHRTRCTTIALTG